MISLWFLGVIGTIAVVYGGVNLLPRINTPKTLTKLDTDNPQLKYEMEVFKGLAESGLANNEKMLETQREHIEELQKLDRTTRGEKKTIELQNFKMIKSIETFNLCCELIARNPILMDMLVKGSEDEGVEILRRTINLDDEGFNNNKNSLKQIVSCVKKGMLPSSHK